MRPLMFGGIVASILALPSIVPAQEPRADFGQTVRSVRQGIFLIGCPKVGTGSACVISKKHRLLATNAHVADLAHEVAKVKGRQLLAMRNGSDQTYVVEKIWYHPGVRRFVSDDRNLAVRSIDPAIGDVHAGSSDLAVLQLSMDGPELPVEFKFADPKTVFDLQGLSTAIMGYPAFDTAQWPDPGQFAEATFHTGVVSRVSNFAFDAVRPELAQRLQYTMETFSGFSGSPLFLADSRLIGLHNSARPIGQGRMVANGVRVDSLWELLEHHGLTDKVAVPLPRDKLLVNRWTEADPNLETYRQLKKLVGDADYLIYTKLDFQAGIDKCNEAIALFKNYAPAYRSRCDGYTNWWFRDGDNWTVDKRNKFLANAYANSEQNIKLHKGRVPRSARMAHVVVLNNFGYVTKNQSFNRDALKMVNSILNEGPADPWEKGIALSHKAIALSNLEDSDGARNYHQQALSANPDSAILWENRANFMENNNNAAQGQADRAVARALRKKDMLLKETNWQDHKVVNKMKGHMTRKDSLDNAGRYRQVWTVDLEEGYYYQVDLKNPSFRTDKDFDPILRINDDKNRTLFEDDDNGGFPNARIFFTASRTGTYKLYVTSYRAGQTGPFLLTVTRIAKDR